MKKETNHVTEFVNGLARLTPDGAEILDSTPMSLPVGFTRPESIQETIRRLVTDPAIRAELEGSGLETFDEADDFECPDEEFPLESPYEEDFDPGHVIARDQEVKHGAVRDWTPEERSAALILARRAEEAAKAKQAAAPENIRPAKKAAGE